MSEKINILLIEDELIVAVDFAASLTQNGYNIVAVVDNANEALLSFQTQNIDMVLCSINNFKFYQSKSTPAVSPPPVKNTPELVNSSIFKSDDMLFIKQTHQFIRLPENDILYIEADNKYVIIYTVAKKYLLKQSLSSVIEQINYPKLLQVHRSFVVNIDKVEMFNDSKVVINEKNLPIGRRYKQTFKQSFKLQ